MPFYRLEFDYVMHDINFSNPMNLVSFSSFGIGFETAITKKICILTKWEWLWGMPEEDHFEQWLKGRLGASYILYGTNKLYEYRRKTQYTGLQTRTVTVNYIHSMDIGIDMLYGPIVMESFANEDQIIPEDNINLLFYTGYRFQKLYLKFAQPYDSFSVWVQGIIGYSHMYDYDGYSELQVQYGGRIGIRFYLFTGEITYINNELSYSIGCYLQTTWAKK